MRKKQKYCEDTVEIDLKKLDELSQMVDAELAELSRKADAELAELSRMVELFEADMEKKI